MSIFVFLGPTLPVTVAREILDATYLPPVSMGDVYALMKRQPEVIAIIDGLFQRVPAVWHKEILFALSQGVRVFGSSSMGALRAAELHTFGMEGVGQVFEAYRDGLFEDDDEVAVIHGPEEFGYRQLSEAMVNIRVGLRQAEIAGAICSATHHALLCAAKRTFYRERSWPSLLERGAALGLPEIELTALGQMTRRDAPNVKRDDAVELLQRIATHRADGITSHQPTFHFEPTDAWVKLMAVESRPDAKDQSDWDQDKNNTATLTVAR